MPFKSQAQRSFLFAKHPDIAKRWAAKYGGGGSHLPKHVAKESELNYTADKELLLGKSDTWSTASSPDPCPSCSKIGTHRLSCPNDKVAPWGAWKKPATAEKKSEVTEMVHKGFKLFREELGAREPKAKKEAQFADRHSIDRTEYPLKNKPEGLGKPKDKAQLKGAAGERQVLKQGTSDLPDKSGFKNAQTPVTFAHKREGEFKPLSISPSTVKPELKGTK